MMMMKLFEKKKPQGKSRGQAGYGEGKASIAFDDDVLLDEEEMVEKLLTCLTSPDYQPPTLPAVAMELMHLSQQPDVDFADVVKLLEQDSMIAGRILKLVQSPIYSGANKLTSLHDALVRLGLRTLRDLVMEIAMNLKVFKSIDYGDTMELLRSHSTMTAHLSKKICKYTSIEGEFAFMAGLLHDVGIAGTLLALSDRKGKRRTPPDLVAIWPAVDRVHERAGEIIAKHWNLPADITLAISAHHQVMIQGTAHPLAATIALADDLAHEMGWGVIPKANAEMLAMTELERDCVRSHTSTDRSLAKTLECSREVLGLGEPQMALILTDAQELSEKFRDG
jgi:HD-like signal output (HDOD) protein